MRRRQYRVLPPYATPVNRWCVVGVGSGTPVSVRVESVRLNRLPVYSTEGNDVFFPLGGLLYPGSNSGNGAYIPPGYFHSTCSNHTLPQLLPM